LPLLQFKDFTGAADAAALARGRQLVAAMGAVEDRAESEAYLNCEDEFPGI
jgi:hypothetical protein